MRLQVVLITSVMLCTHAFAQQVPEPIIDIHLHAVRSTSQGPPPIGICAPSPGFPPARDGASWGETFMNTLKSPDCEHPLMSPVSDAEMKEKTLALLKRRNIYAVTSGPLVDAWSKDADGRIIPALMFNLDPGAPSPKDVRAMFQGGRYKVLGEVGLQYLGIDPSDARFEPYLAMAEDLDIPVGIHMGPGPPGAPYVGPSNYRARLHSPLLLEEALIRHPKLRVYVMHAGWPMLDDMLAMLWTHPQLYVDVAVIDYVLPRAEFHAYLRRLVQAGFGKRVMFGSDQMVWPDAVESGIDSIQTADFLTAEQKRDILYNNAARFLRLTPEEIAKEKRGD